MRESEGLTRVQFYVLTGITTHTQKNYELGLRKGCNSEFLMVIANHPRFKKYTLWLMTGNLRSLMDQTSPKPNREKTDDNQ